MSYRFSCLFLALSFFCLAQTPSALESDPAGWKDILPDASFQHWTRLPFLTDQPMDTVSQWKVDAANRILLCEGDRGHEWLRYDQELRNAIFHAEFRFTKIDGQPRYNSGVMIRNDAQGVLFHQAQAGEAGTGFLFANMMVDGKAQRVTERDKLKEDRMKPAGEWNVVELRAEGDKITLWVNGAVTSEMTTPAATGYAGVEGEGFRIEFRNLMLKELP